MKMQEINNHKNLNSMVSKINIGQEIKEKMASGGIGVTELSNKTHIERRRLYRIFKKKKYRYGRSFQPLCTTQM